MDPSLAARLSSLATRTNSFAKIEPSDIGQREVTAPQLAAVLCLITERPDVAVEELARAIAPKATRVDWERVAELCDVGGDDQSLSLASPASTTAVMSFLMNISYDAYRTFLFHCWKDIRIQITFFVRLSNIQNNPALQDPSLDDQITTEAPFCYRPLNSKLIVRQALDTLVREAHLDATIKQYLDNFVKANPELFLLGGAWISGTWPPVLERMLVNLYALYTAELPSHVMWVLNQLATVNPRFFYIANLDLYARDPSLLAKITMIGHKTGALDGWLDQMPKIGHTFTLELITCADKLGLASAKDLLVSKFVTKGSDAIASLLDFVEIKLAAAAALITASTSQQPPITPPEPNLLSLSSVAAIVALTNSIDVPPDRVDQLKAIQLQCLQTYPRLINFGNGHDNAILINQESFVFSAAIEHEMKAWFQRMYEQHIEIRDVIELLERLKNSDDPREQDLFACITHSLFDEYRFFPEYPVNALATTAVLFGSLVGFRLIDGTPLSIALRFILESLRQPVETNMFRFGLQALFELRLRLPEFPKYCSILLTIPGLASQQQFYQQIKDIVAPNATADTDLGENTFRSINIDTTMLANSLEQPAEEIKDKILFFVNNLSPANVTKKSKDLIALLDQRFYGWFARYIVSERALTEPNYHALYISMLTTINSQNLLSHCCHVAYVNLIRLVNDSEANSPDTRTRLKNLGSFLGSLTLGNNKPILYDNINFKLLLAEAVQQEKLPAILPFVCRVLDQCARSVVFAPPNAWTMGVMGVISELYHFTSLKLNLKFEIEVLCNSLKLSIDEIKASEFIRNQEAVQLESDMTKLTVDDKQQQQPSVLPAGMSMGTPISTNMSPSLPVSQTQPGQPGQLSQQMMPLQFAGTSDFVTVPAMRGLLELAAAKSIQDVLVPVVERAVSIATFTTKELVAKDFAFEADEQKLQMAALSLSSLLTTSLSLAQARDPFSETLAMNLQVLAIQNGFGEVQGISEQITAVVRDNVDIVIPIVEGIAREKALSDLEEALFPLYAERQRYHGMVHANGQQQQPPQPFISQYYSDYSTRLPAGLAISPQGLAPQQLALYADLSYSAEPRSASVFDQQVAEELPSNDPVLRQFEQQLKNLEQEIEACKDNTTDSKFTADHKLNSSVDQLLGLINRPTGSEELVSRALRMTITALNPATAFGKQVLTKLLKGLCSLDSAAAREAVSYIVCEYQPLNVDVVVQLICSKIISPIDVDVILARELSANTEILAFASSIVLKSLLSESSCCLRGEFAATLEAISIIVSENSTAFPSANALLKALDESGGPSWNELRALPSDSRESELLRIFAEWTRIVKHPCSTPKMLHKFVFDLSRKGMLQPEAMHSLLRHSVEASIESYKGCVDQNLGYNERFAGVDSLAKLLVTVLATSSAMDQSKRQAYTQSCLTVVALLLTKAHETNGLAFDGLPFFRLLSTTLIEISMIEETEREFWTLVVKQIGELLIVLEPCALPGFSSHWMSLISHRHLMPVLLSCDAERGWKIMLNLLQLLLEFCRDLCEASPKMNATTTVIYEGTTRILHVVSQDFPEFVVGNSFALLERISPRFSQLRDIVCAATPLDMELPPVLSPLDSIDVEYLVEPFSIGNRVDEVLAKTSAKQSLDLILPPNGKISAATPQQVGVLLASLNLPSRIPQRLLGATSIGVSLVAYSAVIYYIASTLPDHQIVADNAVQTVLLSRMLAASTPEQRFAILSSIVAQLRYPNKHTVFFARTLLSLFNTPGPAPLVKESLADVRQIALRVLFEHFVGQRPHSWGIDAVVWQLVSGPNYRLIKEMPGVTNRIAAVISDLYNRLAAN